MIRPNATTLAPTMMVLLLLAPPWGEAAAEPAERTEPVAPTLQQAVRECTDASHEREPALEVHGVGQYIARGDRVLGVTITLPQAPKLAACLERIPARQAHLRIPDSRSGADSIAVGGFAVDVGGPRPRAAPADFPAFLAARRAELRNLVRKLIERGSLAADDPWVRELGASELSKQR